MKKRDDYVAYRVYNPLWHLRLERYDPTFVTFPLKWLNDTSLIDNLYQQHKLGRDVVLIFKSLYKDLDRLIRLKDAISSCPITKPHAPLFSEILDSYSVGNYRVSATGLLPLVEGMIWNFAWWWNDKNGRLFDRPISLEEHKDSTTFQLLKPDGSLVGGRPNIGTLLRQTKFGDEVYFQVVEYLVEELFTERNPVLHGREPHYGTHKKAATLLFVIETLERQITTAIKKHIQANLRSDIESVMAAGSTGRC